MFLHWIQNSVNIYQTCVTFFILWNAKEDILNYIGQKTVSVPIEFINFSKFLSILWKNLFFNQQY